MSTGLGLAVASSLSRATVFGFLTPRDMFSRSRASAASRSCGEARVCRSGTCRKKVGLALLYGLWHSITSLHAILPKLAQNSRVADGTGQRVQAAPHVKSPYLLPHHLRVLLLSIGPSTAPRGLIAIAILVDRRFTAGATPHSVKKPREKKRRSLV